MIRLLGAIVDSAMLGTSGAGGGVEAHPAGSSPGCRVRPHERSDLVAAPDGVTLERVGHTEDGRVAADDERPGLFAEPVEVSGADPRSGGGLRQAPGVLLVGLALVRAPGSPPGAAPAGRQRRQIVGCRTMGLAGGIGPVDEHLLQSVLMGLVSDVRALQVRVHRDNSGACGIPSTKHRAVSSVG
jgi:hypothetical protein